jgi:hypothetical protein
MPLTLKGLLPQRKNAVRTIDDVAADIKRLTEDHNTIQAEISRIESDGVKVAADNEAAKKRFALEDGPEPNERPAELLAIKLEQLQALLQQRAQQLDVLHQEYARLIEPINRKRESDELESRSRASQEALQRLMDARDALKTLDADFQAAQNRLYYFQNSFPENDNVAHRLWARWNATANGLLPLVRTSPKSEQKEGQ